MFSTEKENHYLKNNDEGQLSSEDVPKGHGVIVTARVHWVLREVSPISKPRKRLGISFWLFCLLHNIFKKLKAVYIYCQKPNIRYYMIHNDGWTNIFQIQASALQLIIANEIDDIVFLFIFTMFVCLFFFGFTSHSRIFHSYGGLQFLTYSRHSHLLWHGAPVFEDPWHSHLLPSVWQ